MQRMSSEEVREDEPVVRSAQAPLAAVARHKKQAVVFTLVGGLIGVLIGVVWPTTYTAETRVAVGMGSLTSSSIAGFPLAADDLASNYSRYVNNTGVAMADTIPGVELEASQIPESNVIRIEAHSRNADDARAAATRAADDLMNKVNVEANQQEREETRTLIAEASRRFGDAYARVQAEQSQLGSSIGAGTAQGTIDGLRTRLADSKTEEGIASAELDAQRTKLIRMVSEDSESAHLTMVREVGEPESSRVSMIQRLLLIGLVVGFVVAVAAATIRERRTARPQPSSTQV